MTFQLRTFVVFAALAAAACKSNSHQAAVQQRNVREATTFTRLYTDSALGQWKVRAKAAGSDCGVLLVETSIIMEDAMVDALHYGAGAYDVYSGGVKEFSSERAFRGVAYRDATEKVWPYGITAEEAERLLPCQ
jgi:hypothetical protein